MIKVGDICVCTKNILGRVEQIVVKDGRPLYLGKTPDGKKWQSVCPTKVNI